MTKTEGILEGDEAEKLFKQMMVDQGRKVDDATKHQNMIHHIDFFVNNVAYDVKSEKALIRGDGSTRVIWVETKGITGYPGWMHGMADIISFYVDGEFWDVDRVALENYVQNEITNSKVFKVAKYKKWYTRDGNRDVIAYFHHRDILPLVTVKHKV